jgi:hypothetical protein
MANVLSLAVKITGDASGLQKSLTPAERAFATLGQQADRATAAFAPFADASEAAARAQQQAATDFAFLANALKTGQISAQEYTAAFAQLQTETKATADAFKAGAQTTAQFATDTEKLAGKLAPLAEQLRLGAIEAPTFQRAIEAAAGVDLSASERGAELLGQLREQAAAGTLDFEQAAESLRQFADEEERSAELAAQAARIQERNRDASADRADEIARLDELLGRGLIVQREYDAELAKATGLNDQIAEAERERAQQSQRAAQIIQQNLTAEERAQQNFANSVSEFEQLRRAGLLTEEQYAKAVERVSREYAKATIAASDYGDATKEAVNESLKFNELSGIFAAIPGPLGNIAGRLSGLTSAGEGLTRVFSGGFSAGLGNIASSFAAIANPATLAAAGIAGVGAAAAAVVNGLVGLEDRVERLSNQAFQLGVSFEFVQTLEESAIRSGTSVDVLRSATTRLQQQLVEAANGSETAQRAIAGLGLAAEDLANASPDEQFRLIAESITSIEDPAERTAAATRLFGEAGVQLLPFFRNLGGAANDMERLNAQLSSVDRTRIEELGTSFDGVNVAIRGLGQELLTPFIGITRSISDSLSPAIATFGRNIGALLDIFSPLTSLIGTVVSQFLNLGSTLGNIIGTVLEPFAAAGRLVSSVFDEIASATTSLFQPINDVVLSFREFFQFEGVFSGIAEAVGSVGQAFQDTFGRIADIVSRVATIVTTAFGQLTGVIQRFVGGTVERVTSLVSRFAEFTGLADVVRGFASAVTSAFSGLWEGIKAIVGQVGGFIERVLDFAENWLGISREIEQPVQATIEVNAPQAVQLTEDLVKAQESVAEFGNAGVEAFLEYQAQLEDIAELVAEGEYDGEAQQRAIAQATAEFERQRDVLKEQAAEQERLAEAERRRAEEAERAAQRQIDADQRVVDGLLNQIRVEEEFGGDSARARAADNVLSIEREIARVEEEQRKAREAGDQGAADAAASRLAQLDQVAARERDIASGAAAEREAQEKALADAAKEQERLLEQRRREEERIQQQVAQAQERYAERATEIEAARVDALNSALAGPVQANDLRSAEGAATFLNLASGAEDPALAEYRKQLKELQGLRRDIQAFETQKAEILAGTG